MSFSNTTDYRGLRQQKVDAMEALISKAQGEKRNLNAKEAESFDQLERECRQLERSARSVESYGQREAGQPVKRVLTADEDKRQKAFDAYLRHGIRGPELRTMYDAGLNEAGFQDSGTAGGFLVPQGFWDQLTIALKAYGGYAGFYNQLTTSTGNPMDFPTNDPTAIEGHIIGEAVQDAFQDYTIGQGQLQAWTYTSKIILASIELVTDSSIDISSFVSDRVAESIGRAEGAHSVNGTGSGQPLGLITSLAAKGAVGSGSGGYYTLSAGTTTNYVGGGDTTVTELVGNVLGPVTLANMVKSVDLAYRVGGNCAWYFNPDQFVNEQNLADGFGRPLYPSLQSDNPTLLGYPVYQVAEGLDLVASTVGGPVFGDLSKAMVRRRVNSASVMTLHERYADARQVGYMGYLRQDHRSVDVRAAVTVQCAGT